MLLRTPDIKIPADSPFAFDLLSRKQLGESLTELVKSSPDGLVLCLNGPWGFGKTTFLEMWRSSLKNSGIRALKFNAWENDFSDDAIISLIGELEEGLRSHPAIDSNSIEQAKQYLKGAKSLGAKIFRNALPATVKIATAGVLDYDDITEELLSSQTEKLIEEKIKSYEDAKKSVAGFREMLSKFAAAYAQNNEGDDKFPLVLLIDELDRCRPTYAIKILEAVKHFFSVKNIVFILALDKEQLGHSIRSQYGVGMNVNGYLRRFFDVDLDLPKPKVESFCAAQFSRFGLEKFFKSREAYQEARNDRENLEELLIDFFYAYKCSLRDQERCFSALALSLRMTPTNFHIHPILLAALIVIKVMEPDLYRAYVNESANHDEVIKSIRSAGSTRNPIDGNFGEVLEAYLVSCRAQRSEAETVISHYKVLVETSTDTRIRERASTIIQFLQSPRYRNVYGCLRHLLPKIELAIQE